MKKKLKLARIHDKTYGKNDMKSSFDTNGSYTGTDYDDKYAKPVQDADDL